MIEKIKYDIMLAEDTINDHNNIGFLMKLGHFFRVFKLVILILNISYFFGIIFMIVAELARDLAAEDTDQEFYLDHFSIEERSDYV